jgi:MFS family permease
MSAKATQLTSTHRLKPNGYRWFVVGLFFSFMLLHQTDKLLIGSMADLIKNDFGVSLRQWGLVSTVALVVGTIMYPIWGYLYDRYARSKLLSLASFLWGSTTWLNALAPNFGVFLATRASTGIDDSSYPGLYSLITDYFNPRLRGRIYGILQLTAPIGFLLGMVLGLMLAGSIGWRNIFFITGGLGVALALIMFFLLREPPRGQSEPEMEGLKETIEERFAWSKVFDVIKMRSLILVYIQGFFGVFPWNAITYFFILYLKTERGYDDTSVLGVMVPAILILSAGYPLGGALGDYLFKRTPKGRAYVGTFGVLMGAVLFYITLNLPKDGNPITFILMMGLSAIFIPLAAPNVIGIVNDVTLPEVRSTAVAIENFLENIGAAASPALVGYVASLYMPESLEKAFLWICTSTWIICGVVFLLAAQIIPRDVAVLRREMARRAEAERLAQEKVS